MFVTLSAENTFQNGADESTQVCRSWSCPKKGMTQCPGSNVTQCIMDWNICDGVAQCQG